MKNKFAATAAFFGAIAVGLGALGAHALKQKMEEGLVTASQLAAFDTATKYQLTHSILLFALAYINKNSALKLYNIASYLLVTGMVLFSGSIYLLSTRGISGINAGFILGPLTPLGGVCLIAAWMCIALQALKKNGS